MVKSSLPICTLMMVAAYCYVHTSSLLLSWNTASKNQHRYNIRARITKYFCYYFPCFSLIKDKRANNGGKYVLLHFPSFKRSPDSQPFFQVIPSKGIDLERGYALVLQNIYKPKGITKEAMFVPCTNPEGLALLRRAGVANCGHPSTWAPTPTFDVHEFFTTITNELQTDELPVEVQNRSFQRFNHFDDLASDYQSEEDGAQDEFGAYHSHDHDHETAFSNSDFEIKFQERPSFMTPKPLRPLTANVLGKKLSHQSVTKFTAKSPVTVPSVQAQTRSTLPGAQGIGLMKTPSPPQKPKASGLNSLESLMTNISEESSPSFSQARSTFGAAKSRKLTSVLPVKGRSRIAHALFAAERLSSSDDSDHQPAFDHDDDAMGHYTDLEQMDSSPPTGASQTGKRSVRSKSKQETKASSSTTALPSKRQRKPSSKIVDLSESTC